ncbi:hypothetical protein ACFL6B_06450, partial [Thermodesulfobacteriota bacterium]
DLDGKIKIRGKTFEFTEKDKFHESMECVQAEPSICDGDVEWNCNDFPNNDPSIELCCEFEDDVELDDEFVTGIICIVHMNDSENNPMEVHGHGSAKNKINDDEAKLKIKLHYAGTWFEEYPRAGYGKLKAKFEGVPVITW